MRKTVSKETTLEKIRGSLKEAPSATKVKAWTFQIEKQNYVVLSYFIPRLSNHIAVYPSNKKGLKTSTTPVLTISNSTDYIRGFEEALKILLPEEFHVDQSEPLETIA